MINTRISVRNLIEFILREGDIDNRFGTGSEEALQEGVRIHKQIQRQAGADYRPEVSLKYSYVEEDVEISIEGRADGIIENESGVTVDEIKSTYADVMKYTEGKPIHLAQAKFYAFIMAIEKDLPAVKVRLTYVNIDTEEIRYFNYTFLREELTEFVEGVCHEYVKWARLKVEWENERNESLKDLPFPYPYRKGQEDLVKQVYYTIYHSKKLFLEAPTGVGKTLATLYPSLEAMGKGMGSTLFYLTAKTITRTVAEDAVSVLRSKGLKLKNITLTAKEKICMTEEHECNPESCPYAKGHFDRVNDCVYDLITHEEAITAAKVLEYAKRYQVCPFEMSLDASLFADMLICDYNYAFDPTARLKRFFEDETRTGNYLLLIDEAHNLVDRAREMYSAVITREQIKFVSKLTKEELPLLSKKFDKCDKALKKLKTECEDYLINPSIDEFSNELAKAYGAMENFFREERSITKKKKAPKEIRDGVLEFYFEVGHFLDMQERIDENYCVYCTYDDKEQFYIKLFCVNPRNNLMECMTAARSCVLFSATLLPVQYYKNLLGGERSDYEVYAESVFDPERRGLFVATDATSKYTRRNDNEYLKIARYIHETVEARCGNYMVFFPSYAFMERVYLAYQGEYPFDESELLMQYSNMREEDREAFLKRFEVNRDSDGLFEGIDAEIEEETDSSLVGFCVMGGIFSEGIDLTDESLIGAIIVGTGLPQVCFEREIMKETFSGEDVDGFDYAYKYPGMNKVLQAAGRVIRTESDIGVVVLLDERFLGRQYLSLFPKEWEDYNRVSISNVRGFLERFWEQWY